MGGYGSTRWGNTRTRQYTGACLRLDLTKIAPYLTVRRQSLIWRWTWQNGSESSITMGTCREAVTLSYTRQRGQEAPTAIADAITVEWTPCAYGGERPWFGCPGCDRRVRVIFLPPGRDRFRCRHCHCLAYGSQQISPDDRHLAQIRKIQRRLGAETTDIFPWSLPPRPSGMHEPTYERLCAQLLDHEEKRQAILAVQSARLLARCDRILGRYTRD